MKKFKKHFFIIPYQPDSFNQVYFGKRGEMTEMKLRWEERTATVLENEMLDKKLPRRMKGVAEFFFKLYFETQRNRDEDNYHLIIKGIMDAFVTVGILKDDSSKYALQNGARIYVDPERPRIEIFIVNRYEDHDYTSIATEREKAYVAPVIAGSAGHAKENNSWGWGYCETLSVGVLAGWARERARETKGV